ncbi:DUF1501 domain-containing protein [Aestuariivirga sp.]|uniref:DUF1501 domain-containing protein n=1 Tax=Aestuariivirga sp. TaxID=2650926 RepID=UPI003BAD2C4D
MINDHYDHHDIDPLALEPVDGGCAESQLLLSRRNMLGLSVSLFSLAFAPRIASAAGAADPRLLIVLLRGGVDGLNVLPFDHASYSPASRGTLCLDLAKQLDVGGGFKLNAVMKNFHDMFTRDNARIILPIAPPLQTRSHFDCAFNLENGLAASARSDSGWLNRLFATIPGQKKIQLGGKPLQIGNTPVILSGSEPVFSWSPWVYSPDFFKSPAAARLTSIYDTAAPQLGRVLKDGAATDAAAVGRPEDKPYSDALQRSFIGAARLLGADTGPRVAVLTVDNFDTHVAASANTAKVLSNFDTSLGLFRDRAMSLGYWDKTVVVCVSEFGRTVSDNGNGGCDHGIGTTALLAGGAIKKRGIIGEWPNLLAPGALAANKDVYARYDTRDLFKAVIKEHLDIADAGTNTQFINKDVFPGVDMLPTGISKLSNVLGGA